MKKILFALVAMAVMVSCNKKSTTEEPTPTPTPQEDELTVSTEPTNRVAVIEEYTGINCGYCPDGHAIVNEIVANNPGKAFGVNIHEGSYAANTYTTTEGNTYAGEADINGYPAGCVNRHVFGTSMSLGRGTFANAVKKILKEASPVNINASAVINQETRELKVKVKGYFTAEQTVTSNSLYVMILQDSVMGTQANYGNYNPDYIVGNKYRHMHMLRKTLPETWGDEITPLTVGTYFNKEYTYTIPAQLGIRPIDAVLKDLRILVFIAEGHKEILTACHPEVVLK